MMNLSENSRNISLMFSVISFTNGSIYQYEDMNKTGTNISGEVEEGSYMYVPIMWSFFVVIGLIGNGLVVFTLCLFGIRSPPNVYMLNLSIADIMFLVIVIPVTAFTFAEKWWTLGDVVCKSMTYTIYSTLHATCLTLTAMTVDRYQAIVHPIQSMNWRSPRASTFVCICVWIVSFLISLPFALYHKVMDGDGGPVCMPNWPNQDMDRWASLGVVLTTFVFPLTAIIVCYVQILHHLWRGSKIKRTPRNLTESNGTAPSRSAAQLRRKKRVTRMVAIVILLFAICWSPVHFFTLWYRFDKNFTKSPALLNFKIFAHSLSYANSCVNPFVYAFMNEGFRKSFQRKFPTISGWCRCMFRSNKDYQETSMIDKAVEARPGMESMTSTQSTTCGI